MAEQGLHAGSLAVVRQLSLMEKARPWSQVRPHSPPRLSPTKGLWAQKELEKVLTPISETRRQEGASWLCFPNTVWEDTPGCLGMCDLEKVPQFPGL